MSGQQLYLAVRILIGLSTGLWRDLKIIDEERTVQALRRHGLPLPDHVEELGQEDFSGYLYAVRDLLEKSADIRSRDSLNVWDYLDYETVYDSDESAGDQMWEWSTEIEDEEAANKAFEKLNEEGFFRTILRLIAENKLTIYDVRKEG